MKNQGWFKSDQKNYSELPSDYWAYGYFRPIIEGEDMDVYQRNLHELRGRDLALFILGDVKNKEILDVGCGTGEYVDLLLKLGARVACQDMDEESVAYLKKKLGALMGEGDVQTGDASQLKFQDERFDAIIAMDFVEHIDYETKLRVFHEAYRVLKPGGLFVIKTPNLRYLKISIWARRFANIIRFRSPFIYIERTRNNPDYEHHGLTTYEVLEEIAFLAMFHKPENYFVPLYRKSIPFGITRFLYGRKSFSEHIVVACRKPYFYSVYK